MDIDTGNTSMELGLAYLLRLKGLRQFPSDPTSMRHVRLQLRERLTVAPLIVSNLGSSSSVG
jgi:hypothetical protein